MATSGITSFNLTRDEILNGALRLVGKSSRGKTAGADDIADAAEAMETMIKQLQATGVHIWKEQDATLFVEKGVAEYSIPGANITQSYVTTAMKVAGVATDGTIDVDSITGLTTGDYIGIELDGGTMQWTTINGAPSGDTVTLTTALTGAAAIDKVVYTYTTKIVRPLKATMARRINANDVDIEIVSKQEYKQLPTKLAAGLVNQVWYDPQLTTGKLYIWPTGANSTDRVEVTFMMPIEDMDSSNNNPDFPQEWLLALKFGIASLLGPEYGIALDRQMYIDSRAASFLQAVRDFDEEYASVYFQVES